MFTFSLGLFLYVDYQIDKIDFVYNICYNSIEFNLVLFDMINYYIQFYMAQIALAYIANISNNLDNSLID